jgi:hypothetical protein
VAFDDEAVRAFEARFDALTEALRKRPDDLELRNELERLQHEERDAIRAAELEEARVEEAPLLEDLREIGVDVPTVWDLYKHPEAYPDVVPVLIRHMARDYPPATLQGIGGALADKSARPWWNELKQMYLTEERDVARGELAAVLSEVARREHYEDLLAFFGDARLGKSRISFVRPINKIGNRMESGRGRAAIEPFVNDRDVGAEVTAVLKGHGRNS